ncbi:MAG: hypothetical protein LAT55_00245 [Opitutales bacterium]|nr:hypothetical protein [Opitutales bacterium]
MSRFPYNAFQIEEIVQVEKHPRDWEPIEFEKGQRGNQSRLADVQLLREDARTDRLRLIIRAGRVNQPETFAAALLLENTKIRGIDFHPMERRKWYGKVAIPAGWHQDVIDPNLDQSDLNYQRRLPVEDFEPYDLVDFLKRVSTIWNITLPNQSDYLL